jgi:hypothetical protein
MAERGLVFASFNYRLALFGYPHSSEIEALGQTQNIGLLDTRAAVEWIRANADVFGGDPEKIVLGGVFVPYIHFGGLTLQLLARRVCRRRFTVTNPYHTCSNSIHRDYKSVHVWLAE